MLRSVSILLTSVVMISLMATSAFADPWTTNAGLGDVYAVTTIRGEARTIVDGHVVVRPADLQLNIRVAEINDDWIGFRVLSGTIQIGDHVFHVVREWWRGLYNKDRGIAVYEGWGRDANGQLIHFVFRSVDVRQTQQGCFMDVTEMVRGPGGHYWKLDLKAYRFRVN